MNGTRWRGEAIAPRFYQIVGRAALGLFATGVLLGFAWLGVQQDA